MILSFIVVLVLVVLVLGVALVVWVVNGQKKLVHSEELCGNALSQIGVQQASRWDALSSLADLTRQYSDEEYNTLMDVIKARQGVSPNTPAPKVDEQEGMLATATNRLMAVAEAYPDLKSNTLYLKTMDNVSTYENNVRTSRMVYNDTVTKYNRLVRSLPGSLVASSLGFAPREYLQDDPSKANMPSMAR